MKPILAPLAFVLVAAAPPPEPDRSIAQTEAALAAGQTTSAALVRHYLRRIAQIDRAGPRLNAILAVNPRALADAARSDALRKAGRPRGPLEGVPILIKDNIDSLDPLPTTAGSQALANNITHRDAPLVARLRAAGAIILGKTNLSEWANMRSPHSTSGWSGIGGLTRNPYVLDRSACGSSSGTGAAIAAGLAVAGIGTETDGSITCPASVTALVGLKPTVGLVSRTHVIPISHSQDTAGPMTTSVADAAMLLTILAGSDPADPAALQADAHRQDYRAALKPGALRGARIGVLRFAVGDEPGTAALFERALDDLRAAGAILVDVKEPASQDKMGQYEHTILITELKQDLNAYLASTPPTVATRDMAGLIAFNRAHSRAELPWFGQEYFEQAEASRGYSDAGYRKAVVEARRLAGADGIDDMLADDRLDALVAPTGGPAWRSDLVTGDHFVGGGAGSYAAVAGYPHLTVPMGQVHGLPVGLSFLGAKWSEARLIALGYSYEQLTHQRRLPLFLAGPEQRP
ncbi:amidase [Sphingomonas sp.]|uniref:amidase n=1 Tax=Sphingomonas sp. TaxID=28214 RepID=UPI003B3BE466